MRISRRRFLAGAAVASAGLALPGARADAEEALEKPMPMRKLGRTGLTVSALALGTHPLGGSKDEQVAVAVVKRALDLGITYFDTAPSYSKHRAERRLGLGLGDARDRVVIATKSYLMPKAKALAELEASLKALATDHVDVFQIHSIASAKDRDRKLDAETGTLAAALAAKQAGKCRFIGVTGHVDPELMATCMEAFAFDTILVPVNCADPLHRSFVEHTLPLAKKKGVAVVAMKVFAAGKLVDGGDAKARATPAECVRYALSQDVATATVGAASIAELEADILAAKTFEALSVKDQTALTQRFAPHPGQALEWYKRD